MPKFKLNESVSFKIDNKIIDGTIYIVDAYGTFENPGVVSYDIISDDPVMLWKHIPEHLVVNKVSDK